MKMNLIIKHKIKKCAIAFILFVAFLLRSAETEIDWQSISGGGGTSSGGVFIIYGTIAQPVVSYSSGGVYAITCGFWSGAGVVQTPGAPILRVCGTNQNIILYWELTDKSYFLEETQSLEQKPIQWNPVNVIYRTNQNFINVTLPAIHGWRFYRLRGK